MDNTFYDVYSSIKRTKTLWEVLDKKYKVEDVDMKKFIINNFLDFKMIDLRIVMSQVQEFQLNSHNIYAKSIFLSESFQVTAIIEKLSSFWKNFKNYLKHKCNEMRIEDLILRIEK